MLKFILSNNRSYLTRSIHLLSIILGMTTIFLAYGTMSVSAQQLGSDQPCSASYPCAKICGDHICAPGEIPNQSAPANQTMTSANATSIPSVSLPFKLSTKGLISNSSGIAPGTVVWTVLKGNNGVFIFHGVNGLEVIRLTTTPDPVCNNAQAQICLDTTVTQTKDPDHITTVGAQAKLNIHPLENLETVGFLSGPFQNIVLQIDLSKVWTYPGASTTPSTMASPTSTNSTSMSHTMMNSTSTNSTSMSHTMMNSTSTNSTMNSNSTKSTK
jgi:hypothetical protein